MRLDKVKGILDDLLPQELVEEGDNCGLLIGNIDKEIRHIRVALEVTNQVVNAAIRDKVDLLVVHHPLLYRPLRNIRTDDGIGHKVFKLIKNDIGLYVAHSNLDRMEGGLNQMFGNRIGLKHIQKTAFDASGFILKGSLDEALTLSQYAKVLAHKLGEPLLRYIGDGNKTIKTVGFCTGSGMDILRRELFDEVDVYLTGDIKYHFAMETLEEGNALIDINHYSSERMAGEVLKTILSDTRLDGIEISEDTCDINPIQYSEVTL